MAAYLRLVRPGNAAMAAVAVGIGGVVAVVAPPASWTFGTLSVALSVGGAAVSAALFTGAGNVLNDYFDRETDKVNHPDRPIPSGRVDARAALRFAVVLFAASATALALTGTTAAPLFAVWWLNFAAIVAYERTYKGRGLSGNLLISYLVGSLFLFGGLAAVPFVGGLALARTGVLALLAGVTTLGREIVKDIEDLAGDVNRVTLPMRVGVGPAGAVAAGCFGLGVVLSALPWFWSLLSIGYAAVLVADAMFIYAATVSARQPGASQRAAKFAMMAALAAFLLGGVV